jgi:hypothetical protein
MENEQNELLQPEQEQEQQQGLGDNNKSDLAQQQRDNGDDNEQDVERNDARLYPNYRYKDHFLLNQPTSDIRFRGNAVHVYDLRSSQIQLVAMTTKKEEETSESIPAETTRQQTNAVDLEVKEHSLTIEMKEVMADRATARSLLRTTYTLVALFFGGIVSSAWASIYIGILTHTQSVHHHRVTFSSDYFPGFS